MDYTIFIAFIIIITSPLMGFGFQSLREYIRDKRKLIGPLPSEFFGVDK